MLSIFFKIWKDYRYIFLDFESARAKEFGRVRANPKKIFRAIMYILWSGGSWRSLPRGMGARSTVNDYFLQWTQAGLFGKLWEDMALKANSEGAIDGHLQIIDGTHILTVYMPNDISGFSYKHKNKRGVSLSILIDGNGIPISIEIKAANTHDSKLLEGTLGHSVIESVEPREKSLLGDSGYIGESQESLAADFGFDPNFRPRANQLETISKRKLNENKENRWMVERSISWIKNMRRIRTCYEKSINSFRGFVQ